MAQLISMGFFDKEKNRNALEKHNNDVSRAVNDINNETQTEEDVLRVNPQQDKNQSIAIVQLISMGFGDREQNRRALEKHNNDV